MLNRCRSKICTSLRSAHRTIYSTGGGVTAFDKWMYTGIPVGEDRPLSVCQIEDAFPTISPGDQFEHWRDEALAALGALAALLDERVAQEFIFEDAVVFDPSGDRAACWISVERFGTSTRIR